MCLCENCPEKGKQSAPFSEELAQKSSADFGRQGSLLRRLVVSRLSTPGFRGPPERKMSGPPARRAPVQAPLSLGLSLLPLLPPLCGWEGALTLGPLVSLTGRR